MKTMTKMMLAATVAISGLSATTANAAIIINITQTGTSVVASGSGSFNTSNLAATQASSFNVGMNAAFGVIRFSEGTFGSSYQTFAISGPAAFGPGGSGYTTAVGSGDTFGVFGQNGVLILPTGYVSGTALAGTITFANWTLSSLGLTTGTYLFSNANDTVRVNIGQIAAVPEPATWGMMIAGFGMMGAAMRTRRRSAKVTFA